MKKAILILILALSTATGTGITQVNLLYDDDCVGDSDCAINFATLNKLADLGEINVLAVTADSCNDYTAPSMFILDRYYGRPLTPIGAFQGSCPAGSTSAMSSSAWTAPLVSSFNPGDIRTNYPNATTLMRQTLAAAAASSMVIVSTGELSNIANLMRSTADGASPLTGAQLIKAKQPKLIVMGGDYPSGTENNFAGDPVDAAYVYANWTNANGYPPIYNVSFTDGNGVLSGLPSFASTSIIPGADILALAGVGVQRGSWDSLAILFAARGFAENGTTYFTDSGSGTNTVNASSGANAWASSPAAGQHYLINFLSGTGFEAIFDGYAFQGFAGMPPYVANGASLQ